MNTVKTNDLKKGMRVQLQNGWFGTVADNIKGNIRMVEVEGYHTEIGSVYSHEIMRVRNESNPNIWFPIEHTTAQLKLRERVRLMGF